MGRLDFFLYITYITALIPLLVFLFNLNKNKNISTRVIFYYVVYSLVNEVLMYFLRSRHFKYDIELEAILMWSFTFFEFLFFSIFLYYSLSKKTNRRLLQIASLFFVLSAVLNLVFNFSQSSNVRVFDTLPISISAITLIIFCIIYLFEKIQSPEIGFVYATPNFWIVVGIMIYFAGTFFLFLQYSELSVQEQDNFWIINWICIILKNIFFSIAFYLSDKRENPPYEKTLTSNAEMELNKN